MDGKGGFVFEVVLPQVLRNTEQRSSVSGRTVPFTTVLGCRMVSSSQFRHGSPDQTGRVPSSHVGRRRRKGAGLKRCRIDGEPCRLLPTMWTNT
jgi:hypothetical protein